MIVSLTASVYCDHEPCGQIVSAIICPAQHIATHFVVLGNRHHAYAERLVPIDMLINHSANHFLNLSCSQTSFNQLPLFEEGGDQLAPTALNIQSRTVIQATNGRVGVLSHLIIQPGTNHISHLIMQYNHFHRQRQVMLPIVRIEAFTESIIHLNIDKQMISTLPSVYQKLISFHIPYPC